MHDVERLDLLGQAQQHQHCRQVVTQLQQELQAFPRRVGADHLLDQLAVGGAVVPLKPA